MPGALPTAVGRAARRVLPVALAGAALLAGGDVAVADHGELVARWHLDGVDASGEYTPDDSGHDLKGATLGVSFVTGGRFSDALDLGANDSRVEVPDNALLEPAQITAMAWVRHTGSPGASRYIIAKGAEGCTGPSYALTSRGGGLAFIVRRGGVATPVESPNAGTALWDGAWHAVAGTYDGFTVRLWVDGVQVGTGTPAQGDIAYGLAIEALNIGNYPNINGCSDLQWPGLIDEARVYGRALAADELAYLARPGHVAPPDLPAPPANTVAPAINGAGAEPHPGDVLTATNGSWTRNPTSFEHRWLRCAPGGGGCTPIGGATSSTYRLTADDDTKSVRVRVVATNAGGPSEPADSAATSTVRAPGAPPPPPALAPADAGTPEPVVARLAIAPDPSCTGSVTRFDAGASTGPIARWRFEYTQPTNPPYRPPGQEQLPAGTETVLLSDGAASTVAHVFAFNRRTYAQFSGLGGSTLFRTPAAVKLTVTSAAGATAQVSRTLTFLDPTATSPGFSSVQPSRRPAACPPIAPWRDPFGLAAISSSVATSTDVRATVPCPPTRACLGDLSLSVATARRAARRTAAPKPLALQSFSVPAGEKRRVTARLTSAARKLLQRRRTIRAVITVRVVRPSGGVLKRTKSVTLRHKRRRG